MRSTRVDKTRFIGSAHIYKANDWTSPFSLWLQTTFKPEEIVVLADAIYAFQDCYAGEVSLFRVAGELLFALRVALPRRRAAWVLFGFASDGRWVILDGVLKQPTSKDLRCWIGKIEQWALGMTSSMWHLWGEGTLLQDVLFQCGVKVQEVCSSAGNAGTSLTKDAWAHIPSIQQFGPWNLNACVLASVLPCVSDLVSSRAS